MGLKVTLQELARAGGKASRLVMDLEVQENGTTEAAVLDAMAGRLREMRSSVERGLQSSAPSVTGMVGWNAQTLWRAPDPLRTPLLKRVQAYAMAVNEENARMGRIVAAPTAGSAGTIPGALLGVADELGFGDKQLVWPLVLAAGVGKAIEAQMFISGSAGGCQAEIGSSAAMAAAAVTELLGGQAEACVHAAALALMNTIGLVCDPVGGFVEVPCVSRNAFYSVHAVSAAQLALAGLKSFIPPDEVVGAMAAVGRIMPLSLRETGEGGLAETPTGQSVARRMSRPPGER
ncbi:MAG TPA: L-serine ammonia-lyase, iron-sulfur-dependent, subunit alpha [Deinococcales bacterium]|nr:L-serine ammonia-lyase, iron-sulfur-dependent, subunit alpha [Deinococcales bacterium]